MKSIIKKFEVSMGKTAYQVTKKNVNSACAFVMHQPKLPESAMKLRK